MFPDGKDIVFFDGVCNLCNASVKTVIRYDSRDRFRFASLQGSTAEELLKALPKGTDSIILFRNQRLYFKSEAVLRIASRLRFPLPLLAVFLVIPCSVRDAVYDWVARNRYRWFGKKDSCMIPEPRLQSKFLS